MLALCKIQRQDKGSRAGDLFERGLGGVNEGLTSLRCRADKRGKGGRSELAWVMWRRKLTKRHVAESRRAEDTRRHLRLNLTQHNMMLFSILRQQCVPRYLLRWLPCFRLFICPPCFSAVPPPKNHGSLTFHMSSLAPCHVLCSSAAVSSRSHVIYSSVCSLDQPIFSAIFFSFLVSSSPSTTHHSQAAKLHQKPTRSQHHIIWIYTSFKNRTNSTRLLGSTCQLNCETIQRNHCGDPTAAKQAATIPRSSGASSVRLSFRITRESYSIQRVVYRVCGPFTNLLELPTPHPKQPNTRFAPSTICLLLRSTHLRK